VRTWDPDAVLRESGGVDPIGAPQLVRYERALGNRTADCPLVHPQRGGRLARGEWPDVRCTGHLVVHYSIVCPLVHHDHRIAEHAFPGKSERVSNLRPQLLWRSRKERHIVVCRGKLVGLGHVPFASLPVILSPSAPLRINSVEGYLLSRFSTHLPAASGEVEQAPPPRKVILLVR